MSIDCYTDSSGCIHCPSIPATPATPARTVTTAEQGWGGANSIDMLYGPLHLVYQLPAGVVGSFCGLRSDRATPFVPSLIEHAFYFFSQGGDDFFAIMELGAQIVAPTTRLATDVFEIRRTFGSLVTYYINGDPITDSTLPSVGPKVATGCLYASGDEIE